MHHSGPSLAVGVRLIDQKTDAPTSWLSFFTLGPIKVVKNNRDRHVIVTTLRGQFLGLKP